MRAQEVQMNYANNLLNTLATTSKASSANNTNGFGDVLQKNMSHEKNNSNVVKDRENNKVKTQDKTVQNQVNDTSKRTENATTENKKTDETVQKTQKSSAKITEDAKVSQVENELKKSIADTMGISEEDLETLLAQLGMTVFDLLQPQNLVKLVLEYSGETDVSALLLQEDLTVKVQQLQETIQNVLSNQGDLSREELQNLIEKATKQVGNPVSVQEGAMEENQTEVEQTETTPVITVEKQVEKKSSNANENAKQEAGQENKNVTTDLFANHLAGVTSKIDPNLNSEVNFEKVQMMKEIVNQIVEQVKITMKPGVTTMDFQLNPENLGRVNLTVAAKDGQMTASFMVQNQVAKEAIESQIQVLRENLESQGLKIEAVEVTVANFGFEQKGYQESNQNEKKKTPRKIDLSNINPEMMEELSEEEVLTAQIMEQNGNSVDYTA